MGKKQAMASSSRPTSTHGAGTGVRPSSMAGRVSAVNSELHVEIGPSSTPGTSLHCHVSSFHISVQHSLCQVQEKYQNWTVGENDNLKIFGKPLPSSAQWASVGLYHHLHQPSVAAKSHKGAALNSSVTVRRQSIMV